MAESLIMINSAYLPLFAPTWESRESFEALGQPTMGSLVFTIDSVVEKASKSKLYASIVEMCLYLIWHHFNLYFKSLDPTDANRIEIERLREKARDVVSDPFFSKVQTMIQVSGVRLFIECLL